MLFLLSEENIIIYSLTKQTFSTNTQWANLEYFSVRALCHFHYFYTFYHHAFLIKLLRLDGDHIVGILVTKILGI